MAKYINIATLEDFEAWLGVEIVGVRVNPQNLQGIHLTPGDQMSIPLNVVIQGKPRKR